MPTNAATKAPSPNKGRFTPKKSAPALTIPSSEETPALTLWEAAQQEQQAKK